VSFVTCEDQSGGDEDSCTNACVGSECSLAIAHFNVTILQSFAILMISEPSGDSSMPHAGIFSELQKSL